MYDINYIYKGWNKTFHQYDTSCEHDAIEVYLNKVLFFNRPLKKKKLMKKKLINTDIKSYNQDQILTNKQKAITERKQLRQNPFASLFGREFKDIRIPLLSGMLARDMGLIVPSTHSFL